MDDAELKKCISRIRQSDKEAFDKLFVFFHQDIFDFLLYKSGNVAVAEDLLQEAFLQLWENRRELKEAHSIKSYLFTIAKNKFLNHVRHQKVVAAYKDQVEQEGLFISATTPEFDLEEKEFHDALMTAIAQMPEAMRIVFLMSRVEGLPSKEIAMRLEISVRTVDSHIYKALQHIEARLPKEYIFRKKKNKSD